MLPSLILVESADDAREIKPAERHRRDVEERAHARGRTASIRDVAPPAFPLGLRKSQVARGATRSARKRAGSKQPLMPGRLIG